MKFNITEIESCIEERRTIKPEKFTSRKVHKEIITRLLNAARWAPNNGMTQPWHFKIFTGEGLTKLGQGMADIYKSTTEESQFNPSRFEKLLTRPKLTSVGIAICMKPDENGEIPEIEEVEAVACSVQNIHLMATAYGLGGYWAKGSVAYSDEMKTFLGLAPEDKCLGFFYLGYPEGDWTKSHRKPLEYNTDWIEK